MSDGTSNLETDWERQRAFLVVIREGSLSAAARALGVSQPTVRRRIEDLEREHGVVLFTRSPSGLLPTAIAFELAGHVETMSRAAQLFGRAASAEAGSPAGTVRITASEVMGVEVLPQILTGLRRRYPELLVVLGVGSRSEDLLNREADIAVRMVRPVQDGLVARHVGRTSLGLFAHRSYLDIHGTPRTLEDAKRAGIIGYETETVGIRTLQDGGLPFRPDDFIFRTDSDLGKLAAIRAGMGLGLCQVNLARRDPDLVQVVPGTFNLGFEIWVVTHADLQQMQRVRIAFDALVDGLTDYLN